MQIDVALRPFYEKPFRVCFPALTGLFKRVDYLKPLEEEVSLVDLVDLLRSMTRDPLVPAAVKSNLSPAVERMRELREQAREHLQTRRLRELEAVLYRIEDEFEDLEAALRSLKY